MTEKQYFEEFTRRNSFYWQYNQQLRESSNDIILVDLSHDWIEYLCASALIAKALQSKWQCSIHGVFIKSSVVSTSCPQVSAERSRQLAKSFGIHEFHEVDDADFEAYFAHKANHVGNLLGNFPISVGGELSAGVQNYIPNAVNLYKCAYESHLRAHSLPSQSNFTTEAFLTLLQSACVESSVSSIFEKYQVKAVVLGHLDYNPWRILGEIAGLKSAEIYSFMIGRGLSIWKLPPDSELPLHRRRALANKRTFEQSRAPDLAEVFYTASGAAGDKPSGKLIAALRNDEAAKAGLRKVLTSTLGWDHDTPVIVVFCHTMCDIPLADEQAYRNIEDWLKKTYSIALRQSTTNWIFKAHPLDVYYDKTNLFDRMSVDCKTANIRFVRNELSQAEIMALADLTVTIRGTIGIESIVDGVPCVAAGRSAYSEIGFTKICLEPPEYEEHLENVSSIPPVSAVDRSTARQFQYFDSVSCDIQSTAVPKTGSSYDGMTEYYRNLAALSLTYDRRRDPLWTAVKALSEESFGRAVDPIWKMSTEIDGLVEVEGRDPLTHALTQLPLTRLEFDEGAEGTQWLCGGFYPPDDAGSCWSRRVYASIAFPIGSSSKPEHKLGLRIRVLIQGQSLSLVDLNGDRIELTGVGDDFSESLIQKFSNRSNILQCAL